MAALDTVAHRSGARIVSSCFGVGASILLASKPDDGRSPPEKSIAVLPFENLSDNKENAYFAAGIQDDMLTSLAKIHEFNNATASASVSRTVFDGRSSPRW